ncbi:MAG: hypothetical protein M3N52_07565, partial [Actinomycetota bacterium]|nr:hypothetical protein [Actinomycetota bacterium]
PLGRVDDLGFEQDGDRPPRLVSVLMGPEALGARLGGVVGGVVAGAGRLRPDGAGPPEIAISDLDTVDIEVRLKAHRDDLSFPRSEGWVQDHMIGRIPGARRSSSGKEPGGTADRRAESPSGSAERRSDGLASRIRASSLLGTAVLDRDGRSLGRLRDLRLRADGDNHRIEGLVTGRGVIAERFGYAYGEVVGPWLLVALMRRLARRTRYIGWDDVVEIGTERLVVSQSRDAYGSLVDAR